MQPDTVVREEGRYSGASRADLVAALDELHGVHNAVLNEILLIAAELDRREAFLEDGHRDIAGWLQMRLGLGRRTALRWQETAERIEDLPHLAESFSTGRLSFDKLAACLSYATPDTDQGTAQEAEDVDVASCERLARRRRQLSRSAEEHAAASKKVTFSWADGRTRLDIYGSLPADEGAAVMAAIDRITDSLPLQDADGNLVSWATRRADALVRLAGTRIADDQDPDRAMLSIHVPLETLMDGPGVGEAECGGILSSEVMQRLLCDSRLEAIVENRHGEAVGISAPTRSVPRHMRRQLEHRDGSTCRFPGCTNQAFLDAHHLEWSCNGGRTKTKNLALFCRWHHRLFHEGGWGLRGDPDFELEFVRPNGEVLHERSTTLQANTSKWLWDGLLQGRLGDATDRTRPPPGKMLSLN